MKEEVAGLTTVTVQTQVADRQQPAPCRKARKSRSKGLRSKKGCSTCRARHMKCDEGRPTCGGCQKSGRDCSYDEAKVSVNRLPPCKQHTQCILTAPSLPLPSFLVPAYFRIGHFSYPTRNNDNANTPSHESDDLEPVYGCRGLSV